MERQISEADWKHLRQLAPLALERFCAAVLSEIVHVASDTTQNHHARYLEIFTRIEKQNKELGLTFDNLRRSTAFTQLSRMRVLGLLTDQEFAVFSAETKVVVEMLLGL